MFHWWTLALGWRSRLLDLDKSTFPDRFFAYNWCLHFIFSLSNACDMHFSAGGGGKEALCQDHWRQDSARRQHRQRPANWEMDWEVVLTSLERGVPWYLLQGLQLLQEGGVSISSQHWEGFEKDSHEVFLPWAYSHACNSAFGCASSVCKMEWFIEQRVCLYTRTEEEFPEAASSCLPLVHRSESEWSIQARRLHWRLLAIKRCWLNPWHWLY